MVYTPLTGPSQSAGKKEVAMFAIASALLFFFAFALSLAVMAYMASAYREKAIVALLYRPQPEAAPSRPIAVRHRRGGSVAMRQAGRQYAAAALAA